MDQTKKFTEAVEGSFLPKKERAELLKAAEQGVSQELWGRFNDLLIAWLVTNQAKQHRVNERLDEEIDRYTREYEKEKTQLDKEFRPALEQATRQGAQPDQGVWAVYQQKVKALQSRLVKEVRASSTTVIHDVVLATVRMD